MPKLIHLAVCGSLVLASGFCLACAQPLPEDVIRACRGGGCWADSNYPLTTNVPCGGYYTANCGAPSMGCPGTCTECTEGLYTQAHGSYHGYWPYVDPYLWEGYIECPDTTKYEGNCYLFVNECRCDAEMESELVCVADSMVDCD